MTPAEYNYIVQVINKNTYERSIFLRIRSDLENCGLEMTQIPYEEYLRWRDLLIQHGIGSSDVIEYTEQDYTSPPKIAENQRGAEPQKKKKNRLSGAERRQLIVTFVLTGGLVVAGILIPTISLMVWGFAICVFVWGVKDYIPYPENYDSDYVDRYFKAKEDARLYTNAMLHQAYMHSDELKNLKDRINR